MSSEQRLIVAILRDADGEEVLQALLDDEFRVTRIASTGGFMRRGNSTLLIDAEKEQVETAVQLIRKHSAPAIDPGLKRATVFVLKVDALIAKQGLDTYGQGYRYWFWNLTGQAQASGKKQARACDPGEKRFAGRFWQEFRGSRLSAGQP